MSRETFTIEEIEIKQSTRGPFKRAKLSGVGWVSFFDKADGDFLEENLGQPASAEITTNDKGFKNGKALQKAAASDSQAAGDTRMTKDEWRVKDDIQHLRALAASHRADMIAFYTSYPKAWAVSGIESYNDLWMRARQNAIRDLDWLRNYATSEPPFSEGDHED